MSSAQAAAARLAGARQRARARRNAASGHAGRAAAPAASAASAGAAGHKLRHSCVQVAAARAQARQRGAGGATQAAVAATRCAVGWRERPGRRGARTRARACCRWARRTPRRAQTAARSGWPSFAAGRLRSLSESRPWCRTAPARRTGLRSATWGCRLRTGASYDTRRGGTAGHTISPSFSCYEVRFVSAAVLVRLAADACLLWLAAARNPRSPEFATSNARAPSMCRSTTPASPTTWWPSSRTPPWRAAT